VAANVFVRVNPQIDLRSDGLIVPAPGSTDALLKRCRQWCADLGLQLTDRPASAEVVVDVPTGRGVDGYLWAIRHAAWTAAWPPQTVAYGPGPDHVGDLRVPPDSRGTAVLLHGGFWYAPWHRDLMDGIAVDLARKGWTTWNVEYRRLGAGGGWPQTGEDVLAAIDHVTGADQVMLVGHSAGGQLALWAAAERTVDAVVALAPVADLGLAVRQRLGGGAAVKLLGRHDPAAASPIERLPVTGRVLLAHARDDSVVPVEHSRRYAAAARRAGANVDLLELAAADHMSVIDAHGDWPDVARRLA
jgi:acetyl esterase/lipase